MKILVLVIFLAGCSALEFAAELLPETHQPEAALSLSSEVEVGDKREQTGNTGEIDVTENLGEITTITSGVPAWYLIVAILLSLLTVNTVVWMALRRKE